MMDDGAFVRLTLDCSTTSAFGWGLLSGEEFLLVWSDDQYAWLECGKTGDSIGLLGDELESATEDEIPDEAFVALAKYRLTGKVDVPEFVKGLNE